MKFAYLIEPPFNYRDADGFVVGCDVELAQYVARQLGVDTLALVESAFADLLPGVSNGRWQMTTGLFATPERQKVAAFSKPIWALPDGLLVRRGNPLDLTGYASAAEHDQCTVAVIRDQFQHRSALAFGMPDARVTIFETYIAAAEAVRDGTVDAYASVGRAHTGFLKQNSGFDCDVVTVPTAEKPPAFGSFGFALKDVHLRRSVNAILDDFIGSPDHRTLMGRYGFSDAEIDLIV